MAGLTGLSVASSVQFALLLFVAHFFIALLRSAIKKCERFKRSAMKKKSARDSKEVREIQKKCERFKRSAKLMLNRCLASIS